MLARMEPVMGIGLSLLLLSMWGCSSQSELSLSQQGQPVEVTMDIHPHKEIVVISAPGEGGCDLYLVDLKTQHVERLTRTSDLDEREPRFSPDGSLIVYSAGQILADGQSKWQLYLLSLGDMKTTSLTSDSNVADTKPYFSPDGKTVLFHRSTEQRPTSLGGWAWYGSTVYCLDLETRRAQPTWAACVQSYGFSPMGEVSVAYALSGQGARAKLGYAVVPVGTLTEQRTRALSAANSQLTNFVNTRATNLLWLPDGSIVFTDVDPHGSPYLGEIWVADSVGASPKQLTHLQSALSCLRASPDGKNIYFLSGVEGSQSLWKVEVSSGKAAEVLSADFLRSLDKRAVSRNAK